MNNQKIDYTDYTIEDFGHDMANLEKVMTESKLSHESLTPQEDDDMIFMYTNHEEGC